MILHAVLILTGLLAGCALPWEIGRRRQRRVTLALSHELLLGLELMQGVQRHRALGGQASQEALRDRQRLEQQLEGAWRAWPDADHRIEAFATFSSAAPELAHLNRVTVVHTGTVNFATLKITVVAHRLG